MCEEVILDRQIGVRVGGRGADDEAISFFQTAELCWQGQEIPLGDFCVIASTLQVGYMFARQRHRADEKADALCGRPFQEYRRNLTAKRVQTEQTSSIGSGKALL